MTSEEIQAELLSITGNRYRVQSLWKASTAAKRRLYAVFTGGVGGNGHPRQISEPMSHAEAQQQRGLLMVADILDLLTPLPEGLHRLPTGLAYDCCRCGERVPFEGEIEDYSPDTAYCGGSPRCLP